jgi:hypothetical protein
MSKKKPFVLRLDEQTLKDVEKWATDEFRSTNGQIEWLLREALKKSGRMRKSNNLSSEGNESQIK